MKLKFILHIVVVTTIISCTNEKEVSFVGQWKIEGESKSAQINEMTIVKKNEKYEMTSGEGFDRQNYLFNLKSDTLIFEINNNTKIYKKKKGLVVVTAGGEKNFYKLNKNLDNVETNILSISGNWGTEKKSGLSNLPKITLVIELKGNAVIVTESWNTYTEPTIYNVTGLKTSENTYKMSSGPELVYNADLDLIYFGDNEFKRM